MPNPFTAISKIKMKKKGIVFHNSGDKNAVDAHEAYEHTPGADVEPGALSSTASTASTSSADTQASFHNQENTQKEPSRVVSIFSFNGHPIDKEFNFSLPKSHSSNMHFAPLEINGPNITKKELEDDFYKEIMRSLNLPVKTLGKCLSYLYFSFSFTIFWFFLSDKGMFTSAIFSNTAQSKKRKAK